jgi:hypothetical protein
MLFQELYLLFSLKKGGSMAIYEEEIKALVDKAGLISSNIKKEMEVLDLAKDRFIAYLTVNNIKRINGECFCVTFDDVEIEEIDPVNLYQQLDDKKKFSRVVKVDIEAFRNLFPSNFAENLIRKRIKKFSKMKFDSINNVQKEEKKNKIRRIFINGGEK